MKVVIVSIIVTLLFITYCTDNKDNKYYIHNDKGVIVSIKKVQNDNEVTISVIRNPKYRDLTSMDTYITFTTHKQYNINDTIYFTKLK